MRVLDLGGRVGTWADLDADRVTIVNLEPQPELLGTDFVQGDVCDPNLLAGEMFDLVFSNSVIEHLGGYVPRRAFAENVQRLGHRHWVQTPYRYFPLEPHWLFPLMQHLPVSLRAEVARRWPLGAAGPLRHGDALHAVLGVELIGATEFAALFPRSEVLHERVVGLTKSLVAVRA